MLAPLLALWAGAGCAQPGEGRHQRVSSAATAPTGPASATASVPASSPGTIALVPPTFRQVQLGTSGLPAPSTMAGQRGPSPVRIRIAAIGIDTPVGQVDLAPDGSLEAPSDSSRPAWYRRGPSPGNTGPAVIVGHLDSSTGPAVFFRLSSLQKGDLVLVDREDGSQVSFRIERTATYPTDSFPTAEVYGATADPSLRLITCAGSYSLNRRQYVANTVVYASLLG
jgi:hypothetical protein